MGAFQITGGRALDGELRVHGAKNSILPILAATLLNGGVSVIRNCPDLKDVEASFRILRHLGCTAVRDGETVRVDSSGMNRVDVPDGLMREMRSSVVFLGAILSRCGEAVMSLPGGCELGPRPIDLHLSALRCMGAVIQEEGGSLRCSGDTLHGAEVTLGLPSVGATENVMIAACKAKGFTYIHNAAKEPEIEDLQRFLNAMGCRVSGAGTTTVTVEGVPELHDAEHSVIPDRIVAATLLCAAAAAGGDITLTQAEPGHFTSVCACLQEAGCELSLSSERVRLRSDGKLRRIQPVRTAPYPGFPTDAQAPLMAVMAKAKGCSVFVENMFLGRYRHVDELVRMGAEIQVADRVAVIMGRPVLYGAQVEATDLRGGAALVVAGLAAEGQTVVGGVCETIDRGYERLEDQLTALGADIKRI